MSATFLDEYQVYQLLREAGLPVPRHVRLGRDARGGAPTVFAAGEPVVLKALASDLWHKSDVGGVRFLDYDRDSLPQRLAEMRARIEPRWSLQGALLVERVAFRQRAGIPCEWFFSLRAEPTCGLVLTFGLGGVHAELLRATLGLDPLQWALELSSPEELLAELEASAFGRLLLAPTRAGAPLIERASVQHWIDGVYSLAERCRRDGLTLLEVNPLVIGEDGRLLPLDGVGATESAPATVGVLERQTEGPTCEQLLRPSRVAVLGVSAREDSVGRLILENLKGSDLATREGLLVIKPGVDELLGVPAVADLGALVDAPVDWLIVALPAAAAVDAVAALCAQGAGASLVYLVAGGIGDGGDPGAEQRHRLEATLDAARRAGGYAPFVVGPNSLGVLSAELALDSLFIPPDKLTVRLDSASPLAVLSQSGAFLITRIDGDEQLVLRAAFCVGNQLDLDIADLLACLADEPGIRVAGLYLEGFDRGALARLARAARRFVEDGRRVVLYKAGRTSDGAKAAAGHTGALAGSYALEAAVLRRAGVTVAESFSVFSSALRWLSAYPRITPRRVALVTNAGYEAVRGADALEGPLSPVALDEAHRGALADVLAAHGLSGLVAARLPLDLTPMANEDAYCAVLETLARLDADVFVVSFVPLTRRLDTADPEAGRSFARRIAAIAAERGLTVGIVVDAGAGYDAYRRLFAAAGLPVFDSVELAIDALRSLAA